MAARWLPIPTLLLFGAVAWAEEKATFGLAAPAARMAQPFATNQPAEPPVLLPVPQAVPTPYKPCRSCPNEYNPNHVYLPEQTPDLKTGGCDGDCEPCRQFWLNLEFFIGKSENLPNVNRRFLFGAQADAGYWFSNARSFGIDLGFLTANGSFRDSQLPTLLNSPLTLTTGDVNLRAELFSMGQWRFDGLLGYRVLQFQEKYQLGSPAFVADISVRDTLNAGQIGLLAEYRYGAYFASITGKFALGQIDETIDENSVRRVENDWSSATTLGARVGYQFGESLWGTIGYQMLFVSNLDRPTMGDTDYFLHGLTVGFVKRF